MVRSNKSGVAAAEAHGNPSDYFFFVPRRILITVMTTGAWCLVCSFPAPRFGVPSAGARCARASQRLLIAPRWSLEVEPRCHWHPPPHARLRSWLGCVELFLSRSRSLWASLSCRGCLAAPAVVAAWRRRLLWLSAVHADGRCLPLPQKVLRPVVGIREPPGARGGGRGKQKVAQLGEGCDWGFDGPQGLPWFHIRRRRRRVRRPGVISSVRGNVLVRVSSS